MKILILGNLGYVGPAVIRQLRSTFPNAELTGFDVGYYAHCLSHPSYLPEVQLNRQVFGDIRKFPESLLAGVDAVLDLAAISNDPMGNEYEEVTMEVNYRSAVRLAKMCKRNHVRRFVFASSCSVYGAASESPKCEEDKLNPLTAYARSKVAAEEDLEKLAGPGFTITCLRFATACGFSSRIRLDLVLNDFVTGAWVNRKIEILSDGSPWRPLINTKDMARACEWGILRDSDVAGDFLAVNTGSNEWNKQIKVLAEAVAAEINGTVVNVDKAATPDKRSYRVDFGLYQRLAPDHQPKSLLVETVREIRDGLERMHFTDTNYRESQFMRLCTLTRLREQGLIDENLEWQWPVRHRPDLYEYSRLA